MKDQKVFILALGYDGSQEQQFWSLRDRFCNTPAWTDGVILPPLVVLGVTSDIFEKKDIESFVSRPFGGLEIDTVRIFFNTTQDWRCSGAQCVPSKASEDIGQHIQLALSSRERVQSGPWGEIASSLGYPYLLLGFATPDSRLPQERKIGKITLTRPSLQIYEVQSWPGTNGAWFENLRWSLGYQKRLRLPKA